MSLINQVLRDLDARKAIGDGIVGLPVRVKPLPATRSMNWQPTAIGLGGALLGATIAYVALDLRDTPPATAETPVAATEAKYRQADAGSVRPLAVQPAPAPEPVSGSRVAAAAVPAPLPAKPAGQAATKPISAAVATPAKPVAERIVSPQLGETANKPVLQTAAEAVAAVRDTQPKPERKIAATVIDLPVVDAPPTRATGPKPADVPGDAGRVDKRTRSGVVNDEADAEYRKALNAFRRGATHEALGGLKTVLQIEPRHIMARQALLSLLVEQQQWQEAIKLAEDGLALDPAQSGWAMALARLQVEHGSPLAAVDTLARHAPHAAQNADYAAFHALLLNRQQRPRESAERYAAALAMRPGEARWWYGLGMALEADHRSQEAREAFQRAKEIGNLPPELVAGVEQRLR